MFNGKQFAQQVSEADCVRGWYEDVKELKTRVEVEYRDDAIPRVETTHVEINVTAPQVANMRQLLVFGVNGMSELVAGAVAV